MKAAYFVSVSALVLCFSSPVLAQTSNKDQNANSANKVNDGEIVVTAQRRETALSRTPVSISVLNAEALANGAVKSEADLQAAVPGLIVRETLGSNQVSYSIRGQTVDAFSGSAPSVLPYLNEVPVATSPYSGGGASSFYDLESIQVLKGPQGTLFGRNSTGGAVLMTTKKPTNEFGGYISQKLGNYNLTETEAALNLPIASNLSVRLATDLVWRDGFTKNLYNGKRVGDVDRQSFRSSVAFEPTDNVSNTTIVEYSRSGGSNTPPVLYSVYAPGSTNNGVPLNATVATLYSPNLDLVFGPGAWAAYLAGHPKVDPLGLEHYLTEQQNRGPFKVSLNSQPKTRLRTFSVNNTTVVDLTDNLQVKNIFAHARQSLRSNADIDGSPYGIEGGISDRLHVDKLSQISDEFQVIGKGLDNRLQYVAGAFYYKTTDKIHQTVDFFNLLPFMDINAIYDSRNTLESVAGYAQGTYDIGDVIGVPGLGVTAGGRVTRDKSTFTQNPGNPYYNLAGFQNELSKSFTETSYQFGLQQQVDSNLLLYVTTRRSFRGGGFNANSPALPGDASSGGALFKPEIARDVEVGAKFNGEIAGVRTRGGLAFYNQWIDDIQRLINVAIPGLGASALTANVPRAEVKGFEADLQLDPVSWLSVGGVLAYTDAEFSRPTATIFGQSTTYGPYPDSPSWTGSFFGEVNFPLQDIGNLSIKGDVFAQSGSYFSSLASTVAPETKLPSYSIVNLRVGLDDIGGKGLSIAAHVKNLFDKTYWVGGIPTGSAFGSNQAVPGSPRTFFIDARYTF